MVLNRPVAVALGGAIAAPGVLLVWRDYAWESGMSDGLALVVIATGVAIAYAGIRGRQPDWR